MSVRVASIGENSTFSQRLFAKTDGLAGPPQDVLPVRAHLVLDVQVAGADEGVDAWPLGPLHRLPGAHDVLLVDAGEAGDPRSLYLGGDAADTDSKSPSLVIGKPGLDHVHLQAGELAGYLYLLLHGQGDARRLLAVAEGGVEDLYSTHVSHPLYD